MVLLKSQIVTNACFMVVMVIFQAGLVSCTDASLKGCTFDAPYQFIVNPVPEAIPLFFDVHIHIIALREVANTGGSFGVDVEYVLVYLNRRSYLQLQPYIM